MIQKLQYFKDSLLSKIEDITARENYEKTLNDLEKAYSESDKTAILSGLDKLGTQTDDIKAKLDEFQANLKDTVAKRDAALEKWQADKTEVNKIPVNDLDTQLKDIFNQVAGQLEKEAQYREEFGNSFEQSQKFKADLQRETANNAGLNEARFTAKQNAEELERLRSDRLNKFLTDQEKEVIRKESDNVEFAQEQYDNAIKASQNGQAEFSKIKWDDIKDEDVGKYEVVRTKQALIDTLKTQLSMAVKDLGKADEFHREALSNKITQLQQLSDALENDGYSAYKKLELQYKLDAMKSDIADAYQYLQREKGYYYEYLDKLYQNIAKSSFNGDEIALQKYIDEGIDTRIQETGELPANVNISNSGDATLDDIEKMLKESNDKLLQDALDDIEKMLKEKDNPIDPETKESIEETERKLQDIDRNKPAPETERGGTKTAVEEKVKAKSAEELEEELNTEQQEKPLSEEARRKLEKAKEDLDKMTETESEKAKQESANPFRLPVKTSTSNRPSPSRENELEPAIGTQIQPQKQGIGTKVVEIPEINPSIGPEIKPIPGNQPGIVPAINPGSKNKPANETLIKAQPGFKTQPEAKTANQTQTQTQTQLKTQTQIKTQTQTQTNPKTQIQTNTNITQQQINEQQNNKKNISPYNQKNDEKRPWTPEEIQNAVAFRMGALTRGSRSVIIDDNLFYVTKHPNALSYPVNVTSKVPPGVADTGWRHNMPPDQRRANINASWKGNKKEIAEGLMAIALATKNPEVEKAAREDLKYFRETTPAGELPPPSTKVQVKEATKDNIKIKKILELLPVTWAQKPPYTKADTRPFVGDTPPGMIVAPDARTAQKTLQSLSQGSGGKVPQFLEGKIGNQNYSITHPGRPGTGKISFSPDRPTGRPRSQKVGQIYRTNMGGYRVYSRRPIR